MSAERHTRRLNVTVYSPAPGLGRGGTLLADMRRDLARSGGLAWQLAVRDIRSQYRQAALGLLWAFILPLANTAAWLFIQRAGIVKLAPTDLPYPVYVFTGTVLWAIFMDAVNAPLQQTIAAKPMLAKINFPREALILSGILQALFNAAVKLAVLLAALLVLGVNPGPAVLWVPLAVAALILAGTTLGLLVTPVGILYTDVGKGLPLVLQFAMYVSPVVFPPPAGGWGAVVFALNPLTPLLLTARDLLVGSAPAQVLQSVAVSAALLVALGGLWLVYRLAMPILIERMSA